MNKLFKLFLILCVTAAAGWAIKQWSDRRAAPSAAVDESKPHDYFTCSMHPDVHMHEPGKCPICNMTLVKISPDASQAAAPAGESAAFGRASLSLSPEKLYRIGVRFGRIERRALEKTIRAYGRVAYDPDLYQVQEEYLSALELADLSSGSDLPAAQDRSRRLLGAAETRLRILGLNESEIRRLRERRRVDPQLLLGSQASGKVWVYADVYESDLTAVRVGMSVAVESIAYAGKTLTGKILAIDPLLNPRTRTAKIRSEIDDADGMLKPDMYVNVSIRSDMGEAIAAPDGAVLSSGGEQYVFVHRGGGRLDPRRVRTGRRAGGWIELLDGVSEGEEVVTSGNFLIDSESRLRAGISGMSFYGGHEAAHGK